MIWLKLLANNADDFFIGSLENLFVARAANEAAKQGTVLGCAVGKLVMHKSGGQHAFAFAARHQKTEARRQRRAHAPVVAEIDRDRRRVLDPSEFGGEILAWSCLTVPLPLTLAWP